MVGRRRGSSSMLAAAKLVALGAISVSVLGHSIEEQAHRPHHQQRVLQATSSVDFLFVDAGTPIPTGAGQEDGVALQEGNGALPPVIASSLAVGTETVNNAPLAEYQIYLVSPVTTGATGFTMTFIGQLDGAQWSVSIYDFTALAWVPAGTLTGITAATNAWGTTTIDFTGTPATYTNERTPGGDFELKLQLKATTVQSGFLDYVAVDALGVPPSPTPPPITPVDGVTANSITTVSGVAATANVAGPLANAEGGSTSDATTSVAFESTSAGLAEYEIYFGAPATVTGGFTITLNAQLGTGATAGNWKVDMLNFAGTWVDAGFLTGATTGAWTPIILTVPVVAPAVPTDFISTDADRDYLVRLTAPGATGAEVVYFDQAVVAAGELAPTPAPAPSPIAPTGPIPGVPGYIETKFGVVVSTEAAPLVVVDNTIGASTSVEFASSGNSAEYEVYLSLPSPLTGDITISVTAQLATGATAANWGIGLYNFDPLVDDFTTSVPLTGVTSASFSTVDVVVPTTAPTDYVTTTSTMLVRVVASGLTADESIIVDAISISAGDATPTPTPPPVASTEVQVDLVPCILAANTIVKDDFPTASAYLMNEWFKGFWTATQIVQVVDVSAGSESVLDLVDSTDANYGKCSVVYVGVVPTTLQKAQLDAYSIKFKVRIVYFNAAGTFDDDDFKARLGMQSFFAPPLEAAPRVKFVGTEANSVVPDDMLTDLATLNLFNTPVIVSGAALPAGVTIKAEYADESGTTLLGPSGQTNVAIAEFIGSGDLLGVEELHIFFEIAWFDKGSWAWGQYLAEWGTRGIFQGERRFYLGAVVDDLFLTTGQWEYDAPDFEGPLARCSGVDLQKFQTAEAAVNTLYGSQVKTEHAFNGIGILDKVDSTWRSVEGAFSDIALLPKGDKPNPPEGMAQQLGVNWLSLAFNPATGVGGMAEDIAANVFVGDDLLARVQADLDAFYWQSHTLTHLARDNLGANDCDIEDGGNAQMAVLFGLFDSDNYNWRSMTSPGITGLFNSNCLQSGANNLMKCYPGDNTFDGVQTSVSLVNQDNQFHSLTTTVATNGLAGSQIVPRYATNVYFNCVTGECLVNENENIRRNVCECAERDPSKPQGACTLCPDGNTQSFNFMASTDPNAGPLEKLYQTEEETTTRYILSGRRDKYMFHQANVVSTTWAASGNLAVNPVPTDSPSLLEYWYERVLAHMSKFINTSTFPIKTLKFDNLCANFYAHEDLDGSGAVLTAKKDATGAIIDMTLAYGSANGAPIPLTVPTADAASISTGTLTKESTETYGADTTYIFAAGTLNPADLSKPATSELASIPQASATVAAQDQAQAKADAEAATDNVEQMPIAISAGEENQGEAAEQGFVIENKAVGPTPSPATTTP